MIVGDGTTLCHGEAAAIAHYCGGLPDFVDDMFGVMFRHDFLIKLCALAADHVEQNTVTGLVAWCMGVSCPVLGTESPGVARVFDGFPLGETVVFGIEADEVDSKIKR